jgi:Uma2 family endonuclease
VTALNSANAVDQTGISSVEGFVRVDSNVVAKVRQYLDAGVKVVWLVNPPQQDVVAYFADGQVKTLRDDDPLDVGDVLPDLDVTVRMIFAA